MVSPPFQSEAPIPLTPYMVMNTGNPRAGKTKAAGHPSSQADYVLHITQIAYYYTYYTYNKTTLLGCNNTYTFIVTISAALQNHHTFHISHIQ